MSFLRLSQLTSDRLTSDNPNIANLGDPNRPTKLGEVFSELYDNEWTDAYEGLRAAGRNDRTSIQILFDTLMVMYTSFPGNLARWVKFSVDDILKCFLNRPG